MSPPRPNNNPAKAVTKTHGCDNDEPYLLLQSWLNAPTCPSNSLISTTKNWWKPPSFQGTQTLARFVNTHPKGVVLILNNFFSMPEWVKVGVSVLASSFLAFPCLRHDIILSSSLFLRCSALALGSLPAFLPKTNTEPPDAKDLPSIHFSRDRTLGFTSNASIFNSAYV